VRRRAKRACCIAAITGMSALPAGRLAQVRDKVAACEDLLFLTSIASRTRARQCEDER